MIKMKWVTIFAALICLSYQRSTTHAQHGTNAPHTTHEPDEQAQLSFHYDSIMHQMIIHMGRNCYIFALSNQERIDVHTNAGMRDLESKLLPMMASTTKTEVQMSSLDHHIQQLCGNNILHYYTFT